MHSSPKRICSEVHFSIVILGSNMGPNSGLGFFMLCVTGARFPVSFLGALFVDFGNFLWVFFSVPSLLVLGHES